MTSDTAVANSRELLDVLEARGVKTFFISPGSRNTPLLIGLETRTGIRKEIINDERTSAFAALGYATVSQKPAALVCTSGTAIYNYAPAVAEAYYRHVPLIVITADRPSQWIDQDDSQTLRQHGALHHITKRSFDIHADAGTGSKCRSEIFETEREWYVNRVANEAVTSALAPMAGPVHINIQFANPLNGTVPYESRKVRTVETLRGENLLSKTVLRGLAERLAGRRVLVVAGYMNPDHALNRALMKFSALEEVAIMCETISNLHLGPESFMVDSLLTHISEEEIKELRPDIAITLGGALVSRQLKEFLRSSDTTEHWSVSQTELAADCMQRLTTHIDADMARFFSGLAGELRKMPGRDKNREAGYRETVSRLRKKAEAESLGMLENAEWSELKALDIFFRWLPEAYNLFVSNGTCIRYAQLLTKKAPHASYCNRGVSGIEGGNATALGGAMAYDRPTILLTGDMSFSYNPEILQFAGDNADLRIVVVNNSGGGIFRFIKTTRDLEIRERYFCSDPKLPLQELAKAYGWHYRSAYDSEKLQDALSYLEKTPRTIVEIITDPQQSADTLIKYMNQ